jgi:hypothetical protein
VEVVEHQDLVREAQTGGTSGSSAEVQDLVGSAGRNIRIKWNIEGSGTSGSSGSYGIGSVEHQDSASGSSGTSGSVEAAGSSGTSGSSGSRNIRI